MPVSEADHNPRLSVSSDTLSHAGSSYISIPSSFPSSSSSSSPGMGLSIPGPSNGHSANGNGFSSTGPALTNGATGNGNVTANGNGTQKHAVKSITRVNLPGTTLYEDSTIDREEFVRLVIQSLRDVGYTESAATLEAESGYSMEAVEVSEFRQYVLDGLWPKADAALMRLGVKDEEDLWHARFLISQQKYMELLEAKRLTSALYVLRNELAPLNIDPDHLHTLSSYIMYSEAEELRQRSGWDGASGTSRRRLLSNIQRFISSSVMIPQRRFATLLHQARLYQRQRCVYHNSPLSPTTFSLCSDHQCNKAAFPTVTTNILKVHQDEVWNIEWSHDGIYLASASKDRSAIIWKSTPDPDTDSYIWTQDRVLDDHPDPVSCLAWSLDDKILLTTSESSIRVWNAKNGVCLGTLVGHSEPVSALAWLPDGTGFLSGGLDRKICHWEPDGKLRGSWPTAIRVYDMAVTPDLTRLVTIGMHHIPPTNSGNEGSGNGQPGDGVTGSGNVFPAHGSRSAEIKMITYDLATKKPEQLVRLDGEVTSVKISSNSQYALINHAPNEVYLWDLHAGRLTRKFTGQLQSQHIIRSCFGGVDGNFVTSGSEDGNIYIWHKDTGILLEVLSGHGEGSVNSVAWNPRNQRMFASCSDDHTIRIWEAPPPGFEYDAHPVGGSGVGYMQDAFASTYGNKGKGKTRQHWDGDGTGPELASSSIPPTDLLSM
ncbi:WD40 repeat-like protein [Pluteus cervinus]|uniref:WD40 repeat-like protein n=1 Tax=Pluteus cervinus TaxID=181527 RepID=A0ACD3BE47_9AGAR|nr:WD40 repeat-like protein [Pluteus cervinus]